MTADTPYGGLLRKARLESGKTLHEIATTIGRTVPYLSDVERGRRRALPDVETLLICELLGENPRPLLEAGIREKGFVSVDMTNKTAVDLAVSLACLQREIAPKSGSST